LPGTPVSGVAVEQCHDVIAVIAAMTFSACIVGLALAADVYGAAVIVMAVASLLAMSFSRRER
jgi:hypothetical protein